MDKRGCFVPALIAGEPQKWQSYLRLAERPDFFAGFAAGFFFAALLAADFAPPACLAVALAEAGLAVPLAGAGLAEALVRVDATVVRPSAGALYAGRNRMSSPIQW